MFWFWSYRLAAHFPPLVCPVRQCGDREVETLTGEELPQGLTSLGWGEEGGREREFLFTMAQLGTFAVWEVGFQGRNWRSLRVLGSSGNY